MKEERSSKNKEGLLNHSFGPNDTIDVSYVALQAHGIVNIVFHWEYSLGIVFIFSQGRKDLYLV
jgi:hypothetical protein